MPSTTRHPENDNLQPGSPPTAATGSAGSTSAKTHTDPVSGQTKRTSHAHNRSAAEDRSPAAQKDRRVKPDA